MMPEEFKEIAPSGGNFTFTCFEARGVAPGFNVLSSWPLVAQELCVSFRVLAVTFKLLKKQEK